MTNPIRAYVKWYVSLVVSLALVSCGGGGGSCRAPSSGPPPTYTVGGTVSGLAWATR